MEKGKRVLVTLDEQELRILGEILDRYGGRSVQSALRYVLKVFYSDYFPAYTRPKPPLTEEERTQRELDKARAKEDAIWQKFIEDCEAKSYENDYMKAEAKVENGVCVVRSWDREGKDRPWGHARKNVFNSEWTQIESDDLKE